MLKSLAIHDIVLIERLELGFAGGLSVLTGETGAGKSIILDALGLALGTSQRTVQRALDELAAAGKVQTFGRGRSRRWLTPPLPGFTTALLLPAALSLD